MRSHAGNVENATSSYERTVKRKRHRKPLVLVDKKFGDKYSCTQELLGCGAFGRVVTYADNESGREVAVKVIMKNATNFSRTKVLNEIETFYLCQDQENIVQLLEYFEEPSCFYLVFEKMNGGPLLSHIQSRSCFSEAEASYVIRDLAKALQFLHRRGIAHRDLKPENVLCASKTSASPVKLSDFDLCSTASTTLSTPKLQTPVGSLEYMAPEVLDTFAKGNDFFDDDDSTLLLYDKKCDLWSLGVIMHILIIGSPPFVGNCGRQDECGWNRGEACQRCQDLLSKSIKEGQVDLTGSSWADISNEAKDLLRGLLNRDAQRRVGTSDVLSHPWIVANDGSRRMLITPKVLSRQSSLQDVADFASSAMSINRDQITARIILSQSFDLSRPRSQILQRRMKANQKLFDRQRSQFDSIEEDRVTENT